MTARLRLVTPPAPGAATDADVAAALLREDKEAPFVAWSRFAPYVMSTLRRLLGPGLDEDDLCQEVFLRFFGSVRRLREPESVRAFLFGICLRVVRKELRRRWLRRWLRLTPDGTMPETAPDPAAADHDARETLARYYAILDQVGGQGRSLFVTRHIQGLPLTEVARLHDLSLSTTQRKLNRVAKRIEGMVLRDPLLVEFTGRGWPGETS
ncbi:MAG TPA: sigma-70 family RNA polymerase sigma factor [Polyangia bacterium]|jgi:RNA polymerase sigma-70 factor (ECF subfamily)